MENVIGLIVLFLIGVALEYLLIRFLKKGFYVVLLLLVLLAGTFYYYLPITLFLKMVLYGGLPLLFVAILLFVFVAKEETPTNINEKYKAILQTKGYRLMLGNIRRGISIIGSAGSGKTESVVYSLFQHLGVHGFCGVMHDYKNFEITEMAYPIFKATNRDFYIISFGPIYHRVNPIAPRYIPDEESVHEISRVLLDNLLELKESGSTGTSKFFNDAVEGLIGGLIWRLKVDYPDYCTIPHMIALYQHLTTEELMEFLSANTTSKAMADAFISGVDSDRQTAGVKSTLANAFKKISTQKIFMVLSADEVPLNCNYPENPSIISVVNDPKKETSLSPVIATIIHSITKQMSERNRLSSFLLMEEAATLRLLNMHRIPATLRSYDIATIYVLQDKVQNDMMYGDKASKAILSNLSYQFFGKANDPDTAKYYERFFEIVKKETRSISKGNSLNFDTRVTQGEKEVAKRRADAFYGLKQGEFVVFFDGKDKKVRFKMPQIKRELPKPMSIDEDELRANFERVHREVKSIFR
ncbi:type IV secretory system conjugative DNA transfer family protein [Flagellimonas myxillae]|uniref:type IV secretory system conjugative DNA transfer family protein n=1 Tax=Flagellimonas myxillae TaxID=2942214 RepID=UPI00201E76A6|nr:type IV secretory system conjugative DNA transfer family protein [Muricauda myxillae]MCL6266377.1 type IV secretory system conjugative DNA transfer family protein [Muricauda myxillae]